MFCLCVCLCTTYVTVTHRHQRESQILSNWNYSYELPYGCCELNMGLKDQQVLSPSLIFWGWYFSVMYLYVCVWVCAQLQVPGCRDMVKTMTCGEQCLGDQDKCRGPLPWVHFTPWIVLGRDFVPPVLNIKHSIYKTCLFSSLVSIPWIWIRPSALHSCFPR